MAVAPQAPPTPQAPPVTAGLRRSDRVSLLTAVFAVGMGYYLALRPVQPWALLLLAGLIALGMDGVIRSRPHSPFRGATDTAVFLVLPVLYTAAAGLFLRHVAEGYWTLAAAGLAALLFGAVAYAEVVTVTPHDPLFLSARLLLNVVTYVTAFAAFAALYAHNVHLAPAALVVGFAAMLLAVEVLREAESEPGETLLHAAVIGIAVGEVRWALYFLPLDGYLAALTLLLAFYLVSELMHAHLAGRLNWWHALEYGLVTAAGGAVVVGARMAGAG